MKWLALLVILLLASSVSAVCQVFAEGEDGTLTCPAGQVITAVRADFIDSASPIGCPDGGVSGACWEFCNQPTITACIGTNSCYFNDDNDWCGGDPCEGTEKKLVGVINCATPGTTYGKNTLWYPTLSPCNYTLAKDTTLSEIYVLPYNFLSIINLTCWAPTSGNIWLDTWSANFLNFTPTASGNLTVCSLTNGNYSAYQSGTLLSSVLQSTCINLNWSGTATILINSSTVTTTTTIPTTTTISQGGGGGGGGAIGFVLDMLLGPPHYSDTGATINVTIKNAGQQTGDIILRYTALFSDGGNYSKEEQLYVKADQVCALLACPHPATIDFGVCKAPGYVKIEAVSVANGMIIAAAKSPLCTENTPFSYLSLLPIGGTIPLEIYTSPNFWLFVVLTVFGIILAFFILIFVKRRRIKHIRVPKPPRR